MNLCPICFSSSKLFREVRMNTSFILKKRVYKLNKCSVCGHIFRINYLKESIYDHNYYSYNSDKSRITTLAHRLFIHAYFFPLNILWYLFQNLTRYLNCPYIKNKSILDFGGGDGFALDLYKETNCTTFNIEIKSKIIRKNINKGHKAYNQIKSVNQKIDMVRANHVLEHLTDPRSIIEEMYRIMRNGGKIYIGIPNIKSLSSMLLKDDFDQLSLPDHIHFFSEESIKLLLSKFKHIKITYPPYKYGLLTNSLSVLMKKNYKLLDNPAFVIFAHLLTIPINIISIPFKKTHFINVVATK